MNVAGIGIDVVNIERFRRAVDRYGEHFLKKIFTAKELEYAQEKKGYSMHMAGKFAAKEAVKKALPGGAEIGLNWPEIEILNDSEGKPCTCLYGNAERLMQENNLSKMLVSISHTRELAVSNAIGVEHGKKTH